MNYVKKYSKIKTVNTKQITDKVNSNHYHQFIIKVLDPSLVTKFPSLNNLRGYCNRYRWMDGRIGGQANHGRCH